MISYNEALGMMNAEAERYAAKIENVGIEDSIGRYLAETLISDEASPPFDNSAMDGFALNANVANKLFEAGLPMGVQLCVAAGDYVTSDFADGQAVEIMTGAAIPHQQFDAVIKIEDVLVTRSENGQAQEIMLRKSVVRGENIRRSGEDFKVGQMVSEIGTLINENHVLAFATLGISRVAVYRAPRVAVASTGKELVPYETKSLSPGKIRNSTGVYLSSYLKKRGVPAVNCGSIGDSADEYITAMKRSFDDGVEIFVSTGAVSMGQFDFVKQALSENGAQIVFHKCAIRPGKPILFAVMFYKGSDRYIFGVPGNPVSTAVGLRFFIMPFIERLQRAKVEILRKGTLSGDVKKPDGFRCFFKASTVFGNDGLQVTALPGQASFMVSPLLKSDSWVVLSEEKNVAPLGSIVEVHSL